MFSALNITCCGRDRTEIILPTQSKSVQLFLFASGACHPCKEELPEIQRWYDGYPNKNRVTPIVYFIAGNPASKPATQEDAILFGKGLGLTFEVRADKYARFYRTFYKESTAVPSTVIADEKGIALKIYRPGIIPIDVLNDDVLSFLHE